MISAYMDSVLFLQNFAHRAYHPFVFRESLILTRKLTLDRAATEIARRSIPLKKNPMIVLCSHFAFWTRVSTKDFQSFGIAYRFKPSLSDRTCAKIEENVNENSIESVPQQGKLTAIRTVLSEFLWKISFNAILGFIVITSGYKSQNH